ncbi:MAG: CDP-2,3-bis-(O-geranylgeranyl)-sn-glycerol synthase [Candidatus Nanoarchaeia archaeon]
MAAYYAAPIYFANMAPVITKKILPSLVKPIDFGKTWKGKPILGKNKTFRGLVMGVVFGIIITLLQYRFYGFESFRMISIFDYKLGISILLGALMGFGAMFGDMFESFFKRRIGIESGKPWIPFDQIDFIVFGLLFSFIIFIPPITYMIIILIISPLGHIAINHLAFYLKIRKEKW